MHPFQLKFIDTKDALYYNFSSHPSKEYNVPGAQSAREEETYGFTV
jgi:hypothetical protein